MVPATFYIFWMQVTHMGGLARLNGYPIGLGFEERAHSANRRVNDLVIEGSNLLTLDLTRNDERDAHGSVASLVRGPFGEPDAFVTLLEHQWRPVDGLPADGTPHEVLRHEIRVERAFGRWAWQDARPYRDQDFVEIVALHQAIAQAVERRDVERLVTLFRVKYEEIDRSIERPHDDADDADGWRRIFAKCTGVVAAHPDDLVATSWSDGRLVDVKTRDGKDPIELALGPDGFAIPYVVSALSGGLQVVR